MKCEFSKKLLIVDYLIMIILFLCVFLFPKIDLSTISIAWISQLGISSAAYYWKSKNENRVKIPIKVIESLSPEIREQIDLTQIISSIIQSD